MEPVDRHPLEADVSFDGGDLDCGNGLLLLIRQHIDPLEREQLLEFRSTEISVEARSSRSARRLPPRPNASTILLWRRNLAEGSCRWPRRLRRTRCSPSSTAWCVRPWPTSRAPGG